MKQFSKLFILILTISFIFNIIIFAQGKNEDTFLQKEKEQYRETTTLDVKQLNSNNDELLKEKLDRLYEKTLKEEDRKTLEIANIVYDVFGDKALKEKTISNKKRDRIDAMTAMIDFLKDKNVNFKNTNSNSFIYYIKKYGPYTDNKYIIDFINDLKRKKSENNSLQKSTLSYSSSKAVEYAKDYVWSYNTPTYPNLSNLGGDCANFVSQCLKAGGLSTDNEWYIKRKNKTYLKPSDTKELDYSWELADPSPWISAKEFKTYWEDRADNTETFSGEYVYNNKQKIYDLTLFKGDPVQILKKRYWWYNGYHTMIITGYNNSDFILSYHSGPNVKNLNDIAKSYTSSDYKFIFFSISK